MPGIICYLCLYIQILIIRWGIKMEILSAVNSSNPEIIEKVLERPWWQKILGALGMMALAVIIFLILTQPNAYPQDVRVSNVSSKSLTLSWTTPIPMETKVRVIEDGQFQFLPVFFYQSENDDRDEDFKIETKRSVHYVTIRGLKPGTRYVAKIDSGIREVYSQKLVTGPELSPATPDLVYGKVINSQTGGKNVDGAQGVLVYLRLISKEGSSSALLSGLTRDKGSWSIEASNARTRNLKRGFDQREVRYESLVVDNGIGKKFSATTLAGKDKPWPTIVLEASTSGGLKK